MQNSCNAACIPAYVQVLAGIDLDSGPRSQDSAYRLAKNIRISMLYLEDDDSVSAESYIKKASALIGASADQGLELQYKVIQHYMYPVYLQDI